MHDLNFSFLIECISIKTPKYSIINEVFLLTPQAVGCSILTKYRETGASLITFGLSTSYAPETPSPFYNPSWRYSALYLDGLTYILEESQVVSTLNYRMSRLSKLSRVRYIYITFFIILTIFYLSFKSRTPTFFLE